MQRKPAAHSGSFGTATEAIVYLTRETIRGLLDAPARVHILNITVGILALCIIAALFGLLLVRDYDKLLLWQHTIWAFLVFSAINAALQIIASCPWHIDHYWNIKELSGQMELKTRAEDAINK